MKRFNDILHTRVRIIILIDHTTNIWYADRICWNRIFWNRICSDCGRDESDRYIKAKQEPRNKRLHT